MAREEGSRPSPEPRPAPPRRWGERQLVERLEEVAVVEAVREDPQPEPREPAHKRRRGKWLTRDGCRKCGSQFGGLVPIPRDRARDPSPHACFNCHRLGHTLKHCPEPRRSRVCFNYGRRDETMHTCNRCGQPHRAHVAERKEERLQERRAATSAASAAPLPEPMELGESADCKKKTRRSKRRSEATTATAPTPPGAANNTIVAAANNLPANTTTEPTPSFPAEQASSNTGARPTVIDEVMRKCPPALRAAIQADWRKTEWHSPASPIAGQSGEESG